MALNFFTYGGKQFWEDVFFYQKWRIQRHYKRKIYRLLDNWDICRAQGSFETCRQAFVRFIEVCEIPRQAGEMVVMLHGLGQTKSLFRPLWRTLTLAGYNVAAINYPSTRKSMKKHLQQLNFFLTHCEDINKVSFVTFGSGCLLLRKLLTETYGWQENFKISRVININPNNQGSDLFDIMARYRLFNWLLGPMLYECSRPQAKKIARLPSGYEVGLVFCPTWLDRALRPFKERFESIELASESESAFSKQIFRVRGSRRRVLTNRNVCRACLKFLQTGKFR